MSTNRAGRVLGGRYTLLKLIATGGMGEVWKSRDRHTGATVAAKLLRPELIGEEISLSRLRIEAQNAMLARHPNIAAVLDSGEDEGQGWIIMELVVGDTLTSHFLARGRLSAPEIIPILIQTAYALDAAARAGVVHRDVKPANIMIRPDGKVKLTDFGVSRGDGQANLTAVGMVMGTAQYLAPEQALGKPATTVGDIYALGVIAFEALAGRRPFTGKTQVDVAFAHVNEPVPSLPDDVPRPLAQLVGRLLAKDPEDRPQTGASLVRELALVAGELGVDTNPVPLAPVAGTAPALGQRAPEVPAGSPRPGSVEPDPGSVDSGNVQAVAPEPTSPKALDPSQAAAPQSITPVRPRRRPQAAQWQGAKRSGEAAPSQPPQPRSQKKLIAVILIVFAVILIAIIVAQNVAHACPTIDGVSWKAPHVTQEVTHG